MSLLGILLTCMFIRSYSFVFLRWKDTISQMNAREKGEKSSGIGQRVVLLLSTDIVGTLDRSLLAKWRLKVKLTHVNSPMCLL